MDSHWKEIGDSEWAKADDAYCLEEGYASSRDDILTVSSFKESINKTFGSSLSLQSSVARSSNKDAPFFEGDDIEEASAHGDVEPLSLEGFVRGRSYNIRLDDLVLLKFSPKNSDSTYYFSDTIGGTLNFFHEGEARRCLEVSITLETSETISPCSAHPSRKSSRTITKVQSDHHEVVADLVQTSFVFSIPADGPMSISTPQVSVQWALRFEFFTTPRNLDWTRYDHPLLIQKRDRSEWILPITVRASPPVTPKEKPFSLEPPLWLRA